MPELPEVETVITTLSTLIQNATITNVTVLYQPIVEGNVDDFKKSLIGQSFKDFKRRGKYGIFVMDHGYFVFHLRMEGKFFIKLPTDSRSKHEHVIFDLLDGRQLRYHDTRKFGTMEYIPFPYDLNKLHGLGYEPFDLNFTADYLYQSIHHRNVAFKTLLMDQHIFAGIGNIYSDEICFALQVHPKTLGKDIPYDTCVKAIGVIQEILSQAIALGGSSVRTYTNSLGVDGKFQMQCRVYGKANALCPVCGSRIERIVVNGRSACFCPNCQKL